MIIVAMLYYHTIQCQLSSKFDDQTKQVHPNINHIPFFYCVWVCFTPGFYEYNNIAFKQVVIKEIGHINMFYQMKVKFRIKQNW